MRRFSSEGSLLDLDFLPWKKVALKDENDNKEEKTGTYRQASLPEDDVERGAVSLPSTPAPREMKKELTKEHSISVENLSDLDRSSGFLRVTGLNESFKAYSDSQLAPDTIGSIESVEKEDNPPPCPSPSSSPFNQEHHHHRMHVRAKLSAAKLHLKSLFGQSPHSSHSNLTATEPRERESSTKERRSRFLKQWSQVGHGKTRLSREEVEKWGESLNDLLESRVGVSVFGAFLRSEYSEENLQFYLACEQYRQSSNTFSLQRRAKEIIATYIQPGAPREINLDSKTRDLTLQLLKAPSHNSLIHAQRRIRSLLDTDCYPRFLQSNVYLVLLADAH
ncbi:regulator of G-protein signaling 1 [Pygocentrus nattereri]|uniref:RGS domain-containing protein n=1 Tax=Pygocentrus nattereri TaxID=42514 RepID=A0AAR2K093_PYGNA|nr:regulator of G-protein signaling 1 [Pygocentrus nattereri]XP_037391088.1 regulator of G-protein signaling 1 [Pygocentrus nattereri]